MLGARPCKCLSVFFLSEDDPMSRLQQFSRIHVDPCLLIHVVFLSSRSVFFIYFISLVHLVLACVPFIAIRFNAAIALFARVPSVSVCKYAASGE